MLAETQLRRQLFEGWQRLWGSTVILKLKLATSGCNTSLGRRQSSTTQFHVAILCYFGFFLQKFLWKTLCLCVSAEFCLPMLLACHCLSHVLPAGRPGHLQTSSSRGGNAWKHCITQNLCEQRTQCSNRSFELGFHCTSRQNRH